jgi:outer membrane protein assembly factor BamC
MLRKIVIFTCIITLSSCAHVYGDKGIIKDRETDYLKAESIPPMKIPPNFSSSSIHENYPVSSQTYPGRQKNVNLTPPEL